MANSIAFKQLMKDYEKNRIKANHLYEKRLAEIYNAEPQIEEIDRELANIGLSLTKLVLNNLPDKKEQVSALQQKSKELTSQKKALMKNAGFKESYLTHIYRCNTCKDTGFVENERCKCLKQGLIEKYYEMSNLSKVLKNENFDTFDLSYYSDEPDPKAGISPKANIQKNWTTCLNFVKNFDTHFQNLLFYGTTGLGKTFLCNCIAKELLNSGKTVLYVTAPQLFKMVEEFRFNRSEDDEPEQYMEMILTADLLIIDDLGTEFSTVVTKSELFNFINTRLLNRKSTIISTNLMPSHFEEQYSDRIMSRLFGEYTLLRFIGKDIRLQKKYN